MGTADEIPASAAAEPELVPQPDGFADRVHEFFSTYCFDCHADGASEGGISLDETLHSAGDAATRTTWQKVMQQLQLGIMPPLDHEPRPTAEEAAALIQQVDQTFFQVDCEAVADPGRVTIRRLNRTEYSNTIQDLVGVEFKAAADFPSDDVGYGFDNIGDVLSVSTLLLEKYLSAAETITQAAIRVGDRADLRRQRRNARDLKATRSAAAEETDGYLLINREGAAYASFNPYVAGQYVLRTKAYGIQAGDDPVRMEFRVNGTAVATHEIAAHREPEVFETTISFGGDEGLDFGRQRIEIAYLNDFNSDEDGQQLDRDLAVEYLELEGPSHLSDDELPYPPVHQGIVIAHPDDGLSAVQAARENLRAFAGRAFRRPVQDQELDGYLRIVDTAVNEGESFEQAMRYALQAVLVSPHFLFRIEHHAAPDDAGDIVPLDDYQLATRLSYFLWSSMPDAELFELAAEGKLSEPGILQQQVERMLDSPAATALVENFAGQWLNLRSLQEVRPNRRIFPDFDDELRQSMRRETELLFETVMRENRSLVEFLDADYSYMNQRLATHYGLPDIEGEEFRRVSLVDIPRRGVLTQAAVLTLTSDAARTLPVKRGKWIMENILGTPPPPPPPDIPDLEETAQANPDATLRDQLALHRQDERCAACHQVMDPLGLAFENYDAIGRWREEQNDRPIDAGGQLPDGREFSNALELIGLLKRQEVEYVRHLTRTMLVYALGRGLEPYDTCAVAEIVERLVDDDYRFHTLVRGIVISTPFRMRRGDGGSP